MYETGTALQVRAFHVMPGMPPPEGERHAHDYRLDVVVRRDDLDERGMVVDLDLLDRALRDAAAQVDGADLEQIRPADAEAVTVEVFARWLHGELAGGARAAARRHPRRPRLGVRVRVRGLHRAALTAGREHLLVRGEAPLRACRPGEPLEQQLAAAPPHPGGQRAVPQQLGDAVPQLADVRPASPGTRSPRRGPPRAGRRGGWRSPVSRSPSPRAR